jgi:hypothetical protein
MNDVSRRIRTVLGFLSTMAILTPASAHADITGFNNLTGWTYNQSDAGSPADLPDSNTIHITNGNGQRRSIFFNTPQDISSFTASFTYRATNFNGSLVGQGITFVVQNSPSGPAAIGSGFAFLGYGGILNSAATTLMADTGPALTYNGYFTGGTISASPNVTTPANAFNFRDLNVTITYSNPILNVTIDDPLIAGASDFSKNYVAGNLASTIGSTTAYIGFTAGTGDSFGNGGSNQYLSNFQFVPEPGSLSPAVCGALALLCRRRKSLPLTAAITNSNPTRL